MPSGEDFDELLPLQVGPFRREGLDVPNDLRKSSIYAQYSECRTANLRGTWRVRRCRNRLDGRRNVEGGNGGRIPRRHSSQSR